MKGTSGAAVRSGRSPWLKWTLAMLMLLCGAEANGQRLPKPDEPIDRWYVVDRDEGVVVSALRRRDQDLPLLRGTGTVDASLYEIAAVLRDADRYQEWMTYVVKSRLIGREGEFDFTFYEEIYAPWPVQDRDVVLRVRALFDAAGGSVTARFEDVADRRAPPRKGLVRMNKLFGEYRLVALSPTRTQVTLVLDADPGGDIPRWLIPVVTREMPRDMIVSLRQRLKSVGSNSYAQLVAQWKQRYGEPVPAREAP